MLYARTPRQWRTGQLAAHDFVVHMRVQHTSLQVRMQLVVLYLMAATGTCISTKDGAAAAARCSTWRLYL